MYNIKEAASRSGVTVPLLRAWERRYGVVRPARTSAGYRLYDDASIARLRAMRGLVADGWSPSAAARRLSTIPDEASFEREFPMRSVEDPAPGPVPFRDAFVRAAAGLETARIESLLDEVLSRGSFEHVAEHQLLPALDDLGRAWADGRVDVAAEHAASHAVLRRLSAAYQAASAAGTGRKGILVGLPPGARHELGALTFAVAARRAGLPIVYLGADLPVQNWVSASAQTRARAAVIGAVTPDDREPALLVARALHAARPDILIAFGGKSAPDPEALSDLGDGRGRGAIRLPDVLADSVEGLASALGFAGAR
jgi:methanogenic corrinoid protein MtbC1